MKKLMLVVLALVVILSLTGVAIGCDNKTSDSSGSSLQIKTNHLVLTIDESSYGYSHGDRIDVYFGSGDSFTLDDIFGHFTGDYSISGQELTLDFDGYPAWILTFVDSSRFTGLESGEWEDSGTYQWLGSSGGGQTSQPSIVYYSLTLYVNGQGDISPYVGEEQYEKGDTVTLTAIPDSGWEFDGWSTGSSASSITVTMNSDKTITAYFVEIQAVYYTLNLYVNGQGDISPYVGEWEYEKGDTVTLTAIPDSGWEFDGWSTGSSASSITVTMNSNKSITAYFVEIVTQPDIIKTDHLVLTISTSSYGYNPGDRIDVYFDDYGFELDDVFGHFTGDYYTSGQTLTLDFDGYPPWVITFVDATRFTGIESGEWEDSGTYQWLSY